MKTRYIKYFCVVLRWRVYNFTNFSSSWHEVWYTNKNKFLSIAHEQPNPIRNKQLVICIKLILWLILNLTRTKFSTSYLFRYTYFDLSIQNPKREWQFVFIAPVSVSDRLRLADENKQMCSNMRGNFKTEICTIKWQIMSHTII